MVLLIVSQFLHSRHYFFLKYDEATFCLTARAFIEDLEAYKRSEVWADKAIHYGDLSEKHFVKGVSRYNVNDAGDIYFLIKDSISEHMEEVREYQKKSAKEYRYFRSENIKERVKNHHQYHRVKKIVEKHFTRIHDLK